MCCRIGPICQNQVNLAQIFGISCVCAGTRFIRERHRALSHAIGFCVPRLLALFNCFGFLFCFACVRHLSAPSETTSGQTSCKYSHSISRSTSPCHVHSTIVSIYERSFTSFRPIRNRIDDAPHQTLHPPSSTTFSLKFAPHTISSFWNKYSGHYKFIFSLSHRFECVASSWTTAAIGSISIVCEELSFFECIPINLINGHFLFFLFSSNA